MKILVTGASGLIGGRIYKHLVSNNHEVIALGRSACIDLEVKHPASYLKIDLSSKDVIKQLNLTVPQDVDVVIHCAAQQPKPALSFKEYRKGNVDTTENIVEWAKNTGVRTIITFSTVAFLDFPLDDGLVITESAKVDPKNYYALSKWMAESFLRLLDKDVNLPVVCFRIPSLVQEEQQGGVVQTYWNSALQNIDLDIFDGGRYRRNLIYIDSILEVLDITLVAPVKFKGFHLYNIGSEDAWTLMEIAKYIYTRMGASAKILPVNKSSTVPGHWNISVSKAVDELGFIPWATKKVLDTYILSMSGVSH